MEQQIQQSNCGVYCIINLYDFKVYIGSSKNLIIRKQTHFKRLSMGKHVNKHLQNAYNKYGKDKFQFLVLEYCHKNERLKIEQKYLDNLSWNNTYNICRISNAPGLSGEEHYMYGRKHKKSTKLKMSKLQQGKNNSFYGRKHSEETKQKFRLCRRYNHPKAIPISIDGIQYISITSAVKLTGRAKGTIRKRLKSDKYPNYIIL